MLTEGTEDKLIVQCRMSELVTAVVKELNKKYEPARMTTLELSEHTNYSVPRLCEFVKLGCKAKIGHNQWDAKEFDRWQTEDLPKILRSGGNRKKKV